MHAIIISWFCYFREQIYPADHGGMVVYHRNKINITATTVYKK